MRNIAFIGIGAMGEPMAANLLKKQFRVTAMKHRRAEPAQRLAQQGASLADTPAASVKACDAVVLSLPTSREVEAVVLGREGVLENAAPGTIVVDCSTSNPPSTRKLAQMLKEKDIALIDAPVTRGVAGAKQGTLAFFLGGDERDIAKVKPVLEAMCNTFQHVGPVGAAHTVKIISNVLSYATVALVNEALMLGARNGVDLDVLQKALMEGATSKALESFGPRIIKGEYDPPRVSVDHVCEDMLLAQELATTGCAPLFGIGVAQEIYRLAQSQGHGARDMSIVAELWK
ncbi:MAG TPA: NAD(P)-dependent oxidoreductase [Burkholderiales bacterium]|nr:NAD(P)-dependent oxidoreductase [Burkholderiales bacterium]